MTLKIEKKITGYGLVTEEDKLKKAELDAKNQPTRIALFPNNVHERPETLKGTSYKVKPPVLESALYITINDLVINPGTPQESRIPFEIFINSKNMDHFQWIVALTRVMSAVFRKGGDVTFMVEELLSVFEPSGGYFKKGGKFVPSLVAEIGYVLKEHLESIGLMESKANSAVAQTPN